MSDAINRLRKLRTIVISTCEEPWSAKVYYALHNGFIFLIEKNGRIHKNIIKNNDVSFTIDDDKPNFFFQGRGKVEILGEPSEFHSERGTLLSKIPEDALFVKSKNVLLARLIPEEIRVTDMRNEPKKYNLTFKTEDLNENKKFPYIRALRPWSFQQSVTSLIFGAIIAPFISIYALILSIIALILVHGAMNALSDYFDFVSNVDRPDGMGSSGSRVLIDRIITPKKALYYIIILLVVASIIGLYLLIIRPEILPFIIIGLVSGLFYGIPKFGWKWHAFGDLAVFLAFGPGIFLGSYVLQGGKIGISEILVSISLGLIIVAILHANNWRDMEDDRKLGVWTVASLLGEKGSMIYFISLIWISYPLFIFAVIFDHSLFPILGSLLTIPWAISLTKIALNKRNWARNLLDIKTANFTALHMYFSVCFLIIFILIMHIL